MIFQAIIPEIVEAIPKKLGPAKFSEKGVGIRYGDGVNGIRIMKGDPKAPLPYQRETYMTVYDKSLRISKYGNQLKYNDGMKATEVINPVTGEIIEVIPNLKPSQISEAHIKLKDINLEEWIKKWTTFTKP